MEKWCVRDTDGWPWGITDFASYATSHRPRTRPAQRLGRSRLTPIRRRPVVTVVIVPASRHRWTRLAHLSAGVDASREIHQGGDHAEEEASVGARLHRRQEPRGQCRVRHPPGQRGREEIKEEVMRQAPHTPRPTAKAKPAKGGPGPTQPYPKGSTSLGKQVSYNGPDPNPINARKAERKK